MNRLMHPVLAVAAMSFAALPVQAQQRAERFPDRITTPTTVVASFDERSSYWLEGAAIGVVAGVVIGIMTIDEGGDCPLVPGGSCSEDTTPILVGSTLLGVLGGFLGGMIGATISRE